MGAWIEIWIKSTGLPLDTVAPVWGRGLKYMEILSNLGIFPSPPYGGVD